MRSFLAARAFLAPLVVVVPLVVSCSSSSPSSGFDKSPNGPASGGFGNDAGSLGGGKPTGGGNQTGCSDAAKLVYVVTDSNDLYSFAPDKVIPLRT